MGPHDCADIGDFDLTSTPDHDQSALVDRAIELGAKHVDIWQRDDEPQVVMGDPEGNEFCVIEPGNHFLAGTDLIGAVNCDGTQALGYFWSNAFEWPLAWDQDEEAAIQSLRGGSKVTSSGPPLMPRSGRDQLRLVVSPVSGDVLTEVRRLVSLGAVEVDHDKAGTQADSASILIDPDGNEFVLTP